MQCEHTAEHAWLAGNIRALDTAILKNEDASILGSPNPVLLRKQSREADGIWWNERTTALEGPFVEATKTLCRADPKPVLGVFCEGLHAIIRQALSCRKGRKGRKGSIPEAGNAATIRTDPKCSGMIEKQAEDPVIRQALRSIKVLKANAIEASEAIEGSEPEIAVGCLGDRGNSVGRKAVRGLP